MSDSDLPDLPEIPSFEELGISPEELEELERELAEAEADGDAQDPESAEEPPAGGASGGGPPSPRGVPSTAGAPPDAGTTPKKPKPSKPGWRERRRRKKAAREEAAARAASPSGSAASAPPSAESGADHAPKDRNPKDRTTPGGVRGPATFVFLLAAAWFLSSFRAVPSPVDATAPDTEFSSARAMTHLEEIAREAHPPGSPEHARVREYLMGALTDLGFEPTVQTTTVLRGRSGYIAAATVRNIVARLPGTASTGAVLMTAHYDGLGLSRGAGDDGVGVVAILEAVRALRAGPPMRNDLIVLITDGEELGLLGATAFVKEHPWMDDVSVVLSFEMLGAGGPASMFETGTDNGWIVRALAASDPAPFANSLNYSIYQRMPNDTDYTPFREAGKQGLNFAAVGRTSLYHQPYDSPDNVSEGTVQHQGLHATGVARHLVDADLTNVTDDDVAYVSLPLLGLVVFAPWWSYVASGVVLLLVGLAGWMVRRHEGGWKGVMLGLVAFAAIAGLSAATGVGLIRWIRRVHPEAGQLHGSLAHTEGWYVLALAGVTFALSLTLFGILRRWASISALTFGALILPALGAVALGALLPMGGMHQQWPVIAALVAVGVTAGVDKGARTGVVRWALLGILALPVMVLLVPAVESAWLAFSMSQAPIVGFILAILAVHLAPLADISREPNGWWSPLVALLLGGAAFGIGTLMSGADPARPIPSTLIYTYDREAGSALWATDPDSVAGGSTAAWEWATARMGAVDTVGSLGVFAVAPRFGGTPPSYGLAAASVIPVALPDAALLAEPTAASGRVRIALRSEIGAEVLALDLEGTTGTLTSVNGQPIPAGPPPRYVEHHGAPEGDMILEFTVPGPDAILRFATIETHLRPNELMPGEPFDRPAELAPNIRRRSDRVLIRTPIEIRLASGEVAVAGTAAAEPDALSPDTASPDSVSPDSVSPDSVSPDTVSPDTASTPPVLPDSSTTLTGTTTPPDTTTGSIGVQVPSRVDPDFNKGRTKAGPNRQDR